MAIWDNIKKNIKEVGSAAAGKAEELGKVAATKTEELTKSVRQNWKFISLNGIWTNALLVLAATFLILRKVRTSPTLPETISF